MVVSLSDSTSGGCAFVCSGQGAQVPGMGMDLLSIPELSQAVNTASQVMGFDVAERLAHASQNELNDTRLAQASLATLSVGISRALFARGVAPVAVLGFSLGQISALALSGMLSDEATFELVKVRSELMAQACTNHPGAMSALMKADKQQAESVCAACAEGEVLVVANYNCPGQIVISGSIPAIERAEQQWCAQGKRAVRLACAGAFHSPLMQEASEKLARYLTSVRFSKPQIPLICNVSASPLSADAAPTALVDHLSHPVCFEQSVESIYQRGCDTFVEVGFGGVLINLIKRCAPKAQRLCVQDRASFERCLKTLLHHDTKKDGYEHE